ncbi:aminoglycoside phosphotransferase [Streptomyces rubellomurinus subsp. indigoferus]|nr:aminoglycoside phosphotransferase [Streptomyces rubellomurinus subsp. indigoferus]
MTHHHEPVNVRPLTLAWVCRQLEAGERILGAEVLHGGATADMRRLTIGRRDGGIRHLVLRSFVDPTRQGPAEDLLHREADALTTLTGTGVPAPGLVAVDPVAAHCEHPSLLMTHLPGRPVLDEEGLETRLSLLARQLVAIHAVRPAVRPREYVALTTADTVVVPDGADAAVWAAAIEVIRRPAPRYEGRFLHRDFQPGNVLFDLPSEDPAGAAGAAAVTGAAGARITGVVDWAAASWGPADLDVAHCSTNLALLYGPVWGLRFTEAYQEAGGMLAAAADERLYWQVREPLAFSEEVQWVAQPWREAGRTELTTRAVEERLDAYVISLMAAPG